MLLPIRRVSHIRRHNDTNNDDIAYPHISNEFSIPSQAELLLLLLHRMREREREIAQDIPRMNPTTPLMRSNMLATRSRARPKTDWMPERMVERMPERISKREEMRLERPDVREDIFIRLFVVGSRWGF